MPAMHSEFGYITKLVEWDSIIIGLVFVSQGDVFISDAENNTMRNCLYTKRGSTICGILIKNFKVYHNLYCLYSL